MTPTSDRPRRPLRPIHIAIVVVLVCLLGYIAYSWSRMAPSLAEKGPPTAASASRTTPSEAEANSQGRGRQGANSGDETYVSQNQSRSPPQEAR